MKLLQVLFILIGSVSLTTCIVLHYYPGIGKIPAGSRYTEYASRTPFFKDGVFFNEQADYALMNSIRQYPSSRRRPQSAIPVSRPLLQDHNGIGQLHVTWLGHSSSLIQMSGTNILIDPVLSLYASPFPFMGVKRFSDIPIQAEELPAIDILVLSHDHYDHLDYPTIRKIDHKVGCYAVPIGVESYLRGWGIAEKRIITFSWNETKEINGISLACTPSQHFSCRNPFRRNASSWCGFMVKDQHHCVYYTGDGGYGPHFGRLHEQIGDVDLMLCECGQYDPAWAQSHMFPEESVQAAEDLHARYVLPVHWGAFCICNHAWDDSIIRFMDASQHASFRTVTPMIGHTFSYDDITQETSQWWKDLN